MPSSHPAAIFRRSISSSLAMRSRASDSAVFDAPTRIVLDELLLDRPGEEARDHLKLSPDRSFGGIFPGCARSGLAPRLPDLPHVLGRDGVGRQLSDGIGEEVAEYCQCMAAVGLI